MDPAFRLMRFHSMASLIFSWKMIYWLWKWLGVATYFCFIFKRVNKIRKKTLNVTPYLEKVVYEKLDRVWGSSYLSGRYSKDRSTPLSPQSRVSTNKMKLTWQSIRKSMDTKKKRSCKCENQYMHIEWPEWEWVLPGQ